MIEHVSVYIGSYTWICLINYARPRKIDLLFVRHFFEKMKARGAKTFFASDFFILNYV